MSPLGIAVLPTGEAIGPGTPVAGRTCLDWKDAARAAKVVRRAALCVSEGAAPEAGQLPDAPGWTAWTDSTPVASGPPPQTWALNLR